MNMERCPEQQRDLELHSQRLVSVFKPWEYDLGRKLVEPSGRNVSLTPYAAGLLQRAKPLYLQFKEALSEEVSEGTGELVVALSGALLLSWGAKVLKNIPQGKSPDSLFICGASFPHCCCSGAFW